MPAIRRLLPILLALALVSAILPSSSSAGPSAYFSQTNQSIGGSFATYFYSHGGVDIFGYPITGEFNQGGKTVQYFERTRMEYNPAAGEAVELGLLGRELTAGRNFAQCSPFSGDSQHAYFSQTGHSLSYGFKYYWEHRGGAAVFGMPISEEFSEVNAVDGQTYTVQYFERARFEYHPEFKGTPYETELGLLGTMQRGGQTPAAATSAPPAPDTRSGLHPMEDQMLQKVNAKRASLGLGQVRIDQSLTALARVRSNDMATRHYFSHETPDGKYFYDYLKAAGISYAKCGETLAENNYGEDAATNVAFDGLMNSPAHREIILDGIYNSVGVGYAVASDGMRYFTLIFLK